MSRPGLRTLLPPPFQSSRWERVRGAIGALVGVLVTGLLTTFWAGSNGDLPMLIAPMGASAVLLFAIPASPLAQPWSIVGGNLISGFIGITAHRLIPDPTAAAAIAVGLAVLAMAFLRCIHPPSGAVALTAVLGGPHVWAAGYAFLFVPLLLNSVLLASAAVVFNNLTGRTYPHHPHAPIHPHPPKQKAMLTDADFDDVLADYGETLDIGRDDLRFLYHELRGRAEERRRAKR
jgi:CBS domain-containing membrane protein